MFVRYWLNSTSWLRPVYNRSRSILHKDEPTRASAAVARANTDAAIKYLHFSTAAFFFQCSSPGHLDMPGLGHLFSFNRLFLRHFTSSLSQDKPPMERPHIRRTTRLSGCVQGPAKDIRPRWPIPLCSRGQLSYPFDHGWRNSSAFGFNNATLERTNCKPYGRRPSAFFRDAQPLNGTRKDRPVLVVNSFVQKNEMPWVHWHRWRHKWNGTGYP